MIREARIIAGEGVKVVIGGGSSAQLERKLDGLLNALGYGAPDLMLLSFGVCGALAPDLKAGDLVLGSAVIGAGRSWPTDPQRTEALHARLASARIAAVAAGDEAVGSVEAKRALFEATRAVAVDMESHIVARLAERHGLPFAVVRAVSDAADHALPPAALVGMKADGSVDIAAVLGALARRPGQFPALMRTAREAGAGFKALEGAAAAIRSGFP